MKAETIEKVMAHKDERAGFVSVASLSEAFSIEPIKACKILLACCDEGLLMPVATSFFASPVEGAPLEMGDRKASGWVKASDDPMLSEIRDAFERDPEMGMTLNDVTAKLGFWKKTQADEVRRALNFLTDQQGYLIRETSVVPKAGMIGNPPKIWGLTHEAIQSRDEGIAEHVANRRKPSSKKEADEPEAVVDADSKTLDEMFDRIKRKYRKQGMNIKDAQAAAEKDWFDMGYE